MSLVPFTTQFKERFSPLCSQGATKFVLIYSDKMSERQSALMSECQGYLRQIIRTVVVNANQLETIPSNQRIFVIPTPKEDLVKIIRARFGKPMIYLPRAIIEARGYHSVNLPSRTLAISLTMHTCKVFLVKSCDLTAIRNRINEMCGIVVTSFNEPGLNVVITDRADDKYCGRAMKRKIPVVSREWVDENYNIAHEEDVGYFNKDAMSNVSDHLVKPFYGLYFKIIIPNLPSSIKRMITENQGHVIYGNENCRTHTIGPTEDNTDKNDSSDTQDKSTQKQKVVDVEFLKACVKLGYYLTAKDYREYLMSTNLMDVKQEQLSQQTHVDSGSARIEENCLPTSNNYSKSSSNVPMPPPNIPCQPRQNDCVNDYILKAISLFETTQTQHVSTQMRRLPDSELRIEQTFEPSQQLYWNDSGPRRN